MKILTNKNIDHFDEWYKSAIEEGGLALIDKGLDWTSFDVVAKLRNVSRIRKVGHAGTLDPLATGLLILCFGKATKLSDTLLSLKKNYTAELKLGAVTPSFDRETDEMKQISADFVDLNLIEKALDSFRGEIMQAPPIYSAKRHNGMKMYDLARNNIEIDIKKVPVNIYDITVNKFEMPFLHLDIECSKGTYIRSLASDLGNHLGCGAYLYNLRRTKIEDNNVNDAVSVSQFIDVCTEYRRNEGIL